MKTIGRIHYGWILVFGAFLCYLSFGVSRNLLSYLVPSIEADLNLSHEPMGVIASSYFVTYTIMTFVWGVLTDKIGSRKCMLIGIVTIAFGLSLMGFMNSVTTGVLFYIFSGAGAAGISVPVVPLVSRWFGGRRRGLAFGLIIAGNGTVIGAMGLIVPVILNHYSWRWSWWFSAMFIFLVAVAAWFILRDNPREKGLARVGDSAEGIAGLGQEIKEGTEPSAKKTAIWSILRQGIVWNFATIFFTWAVSNAIFMTFTVAYLEEIGWVPRAAAGALAMSGVVAIPGPVLWGLLADRIVKKYLLVIALLMQVLGFFIFLNGGTASGYAGAAVIGFGSMGIPLLMKAAMADYFPPAVMGTTFGLITLFFGAGAILAPTLGGSLADATSTLRSAIFLGFITLVVSSVFAVILKKPPNRLS